LAKKSIPVLAASGMEKVPYLLKIEIESERKVKKIIALYLSRDNDLFDFLSVYFWTE
jgi:hypothetical protein